MTYEELSRRIAEDTVTEADVAQYLASVSVTASADVERAIVARVHREFDDREVTGRDRIKRALDHRQARD
jgi:hypothetical protein